MLVHNFYWLCECVEGNIYAKLWPLLEDIHIVDLLFQFFDVESRCKIDCKLEGLNRVSSNVYVLPLAKTNLDLDFVYNSQQILECLVDEVETQDLTPLDDFDQPLPPCVGSKS